MNGMKQFTMKGLIACVLMGIVFLLTLFGNILVLEGDTLDEYQEMVEEYNDDKEIAFDLCDVDDMKEYLDEMDCSKKEIKAGVKIDKFVNRIENGKISVFDLISMVSCFSAMKNAPDMFGFDSDDMAEVSGFWIVGLGVVVGYLLMPLLAGLYVALHFKGRKNKGIPVLVLLALFVIGIGGLTMLMTMAGEMQATISFTYIIALGCAIASVVLWKVEPEQQPQPQPQYYDYPM